VKPSFLNQGIALGIAALCTTSPGHASDYELVVVTATRTPVALADSLASVSTVSREQLDARQPLTLADALRDTPSLDISQSGGPGAATSLYTRGTASGHTLFLVDGQRVSSATLGATNFQFLNPDQIERIEVVRGAHSALYGSEAIGGVIQVFTRDGATNPGSYVTSATGSNSLHRVAAGTSGAAGGWHWGLHGAYLETDGIDNLVADASGDRDGYRNRSLNASLGYGFANGADIALRLLESNNRNEYDSAFDPAERPYSDSRLQNINLRGRLPVTDRWQSQLSLGRATDDSDNYDGANGANTGHFRTTREQLFWQNDLTLAQGQILTAGYDYYQDEVSASSLYMDGAGKPVATRDNRAAFVQYQGNWSTLDLVLGLREEDNEAFGRHSAGNVSVGVHLDDHHRLVATWAEGFKAPTFNDLYWPAGPYSAGNPHLAAEQSENREISLRGHYHRWHWALAYFENDVDNLIDWAPGADFVWRPYNVNAAEITGAELIVGAELAGWAIDAGYTYLEPRDAATDNLLVKRTRGNLNLGASRRFGDLSLGLAVKAQGRRHTNASNSQWLGGYSTVALNLGYRISQSLDANLRLDNLFDKGYRLNNGYNQDGRAWQLGFTYRL